MNWLDWLIVGLVAWSALRGYRAGLLRALARTAGALGAAVLAGWYAPRLAAWLDGRFDLVARIAGVFVGATAATAGAGTPLDAGALSRIAAALAATGAPQPAKDAVLGSLRQLVQVAVTRGIDTVGAFVAWALALMAAVALSFFVLFLAGRWILERVAGVISGWLDVTVVGGGLNRLAGAAFGAGYGLLGVVLALGILAPLLGLPGLGWLARSVEASRVASTLLQAVAWVGPWLLRAVRWSGS